MTKGLSTVRVLALVVAGLVTGGVPASGVAQSMPLENLDQFPRTTLTVEVPGRPCRFRVWIANTPSRQVQGLMFVRDLPSHEGMLFPMNPPQVAKFWMANTYIPLDMLFVAPDGRIEKIIANAKPFSLKTLSSGESVEAVIEIGGGEAHRLGLGVGQKVRWKSSAS